MASWGFVRKIEGLMIYCDTSLLFSFFVGDNLEKEAIARLESLQVNPDFLCWTAWHELELRTALERQVMNVQKSTSREDAVVIYQQLDDWQLAGGILKRVEPKWSDVMNRANVMAAQFAAKHLGRSMDVVHVALAVELEVSEFWTLDRRQRGIAEECGLVVES